MRVLHITRDYPPKANGGISIAVGGLCRALASAGISVDVLSFDDYRPGKDGSATEAPSWEGVEEGLRVARVGRHSSLDEARRLVLAASPDLVHVHQDLLWPFGVELGLPALLSVHVLQSEQNRLRGIESTASSEAQARALDEADAVHAPSRAVAKLVRRDDVTVIPLASHMPLVPSPPERRDDRLIYVGRFADINGFGELLEALPTLLRKRPQLEVVCAGGMPNSPKVAKRWQKRWRERADDNGVDASRVQWPGWLSREALVELYERATLICIPSWFETYGQVAIEAMRRGLPIVATGAGALGEHLSGERAWIVPARNPTALAAGISRALENLDERQSRAERALAYAAAHGEWADRVPAFVELYKRISSPAEA